MKLKKHWKKPRLSELDPQALRQGALQEKTRETSRKASTIDSVGNEAA